MQRVRAVLSSCRGGSIIVLVTIYERTKDLSEYRRYFDVVPSIAALCMWIRVNGTRCYPRDQASLDRPIKRDRDLNHDVPVTPTIRINPDLNVRVPGLVTPMMMESD